MKRFNACLFLVLPLAISGCASLPSYTESEIDTSTVIQNIKCEFRSAVLEIDPHDEWLKYWNAGFILTLNVNQKGSVTADATLAHPVIPQLLTLPVVGGITGEAKRTEKINFSESVKKIREEPTFPCPRGYNALLGGQLGILDLFKRARLSSKSADIVPTQLDYTLDFAITENANISPKYTLIPLGRRDTLSLGVKLEGSRGENHTLNMTLIEKRPGECKHFAKFFKKYGICPAVVATFPVDQGNEEALAAPDDSKTLKPVPGGAIKGISPQDQRDLERALDRSILQDTRQDLRRLDVPN